MRVVGPDDLADFSDACHREGGPSGVSAGTLDKNCFYCRVLDCLGNPRQVRGVFRGQIHLAIGDPEFFERTVAISSDPNDALQGIIRGTNGGDQHIPRAQNPV